MWWRDLMAMREQLAGLIPGGASHIDASAQVEPGAVLDDSTGPIVIGAGTRICAGALLRGPLIVGSHGLIGNQAMLRGPAMIGDHVRIGFASEIKHSLIGDHVSIGPQCFVGDSRIDDHAYLGAQVRTSNHRLDGQPIAVHEGDTVIDTGCEKLGCWIGARASLGIQVIVLPGRMIAAGTLFEPRITVTRNYPSGHYRAIQTIEAIVAKEVNP
jgi:bifunctional UDP-N-acetylglucosamine pyrophosphorylase/glucosamine-1-phosphate N-acetyltransferase